MIFLRDGVYGHDDAFASSELLFFLFLFWPRLQFYQAGAVNRFEIHKCFYLYNDSLLKTTFLLSLVVIGMTDAHLI